LALLDFKNDDEVGLQAEKKELNGPKRRVDLVGPK